VNCAIWAEIARDSGDRFDSPADGDAAGGDFVEDQGDENHGQEKVDLFGALQESGPRVVRIVAEGNVRMTTQNSMGASGRDLVAMFSVDVVYRTLRSRRETIWGR
jgi:hypothetical protein